MLKPEEKEAAIEVMENAKFGMTGQNKVWLAGNVLMRGLLQDDFELVKAAVGGIVALLITQFNFSISAGIGFIALFGICIQNGVIMISDIKANLKLGSPLEKATKEGVRSRIRPVIMTAAMAAIGLMPAAMSHGIGSESQRPLAIVIIGGLIGATFFAITFHFYHITFVHIPLPQ